MNKYQEALKWFQSIYETLGQEECYEDLGMRFGQGLDESIQVIKELVERETPIKRSETVSNAFCGNCGYAFGYNKVIEQRSLNFKHLQYCSCCGQKIDWSKNK